MKPATFHAGTTAERTATPERLRIVHLIPTLAHGGAERQVALLARAQAEAGHEVCVGVLRGGPNQRILESCGVGLYMLRHSGHHDPILFLRILSLLRCTGPDVVHTWLTQMDLLGGAAARLLRIPWVLSERTSAAAYPPSVKNAARIRLAVGAAAIVANSRGGDEYWKGIRAVRAPRFVVPNAVPLDEIAATDSAGAPTRPSRPVIMFAGRFAAEKNLSVLVDALALALRDSPASVVLCGDGPEHPEVERRVKERGIASRVVFTGFRENVWEMMRQATVFVSLSSVEGHPNAVLEAMACGTPLVVSDIPAHREFLSAESAWLVPPVAEPAAAAIRQALHDPELAARKCEVARRIVHRFSVAAMTERVEAIYRAVVGARGKPYLSPSS